MNPKWAPFFTLFSGPSYTTASFHPGGFDRQVFEERASLSSLFPRPPSPPSWRKEKSRPRSCLLGPNPTGCKREAHQEKDSIRGEKRHIDMIKKDQNGVGPLCSVRDQHVITIAKIGAGMPQTRWTLRNTKRLAPVRASNP